MKTDPSFCLTSELFFWKSVLCALSKKPGQLSSTLDGKTTMASKYKKEKFSAYEMDVVRDMITKYEVKLEEKARARDRYEEVKRRVNEEHHKRMVETHRTYPVRVEEGKAYPVLENSRASVYRIGDSDTHVTLPLWKQAPSNSVCVWCAENDAAAVIPTPTIASSLTSYLATLER